MLTRRLSCVLLLCSLGGMVPGCAWFGRHEGPLVPAANSPISDLPVPAGFTLEDNSTSHIVADSGLRVINHYYKGPDDVLPVVQYFQSQLPGKNWKFVDLSESPGSEKTLHYTKNNEDCLITVSPGRFGGSTIRVHVDPVGQRQ